MGRLIATIFCALVIWLLFRFDRGERARVSNALWLPTFWLFIGASRNVSDWFLVAHGGGSQRYLDGSPVDRFILSVVLAIGILVLFSRARRTGSLLKSNLPILLYFLYCGISIIWSDFPDVAFRRGFRGWGDVVMVLVVLTDPDWVAAFRTLLTRLGYLLVPLSLLLNRYYPDWGREFSRGGDPSFSGVAADKNTLGALSLIFALTSLFYFLQSYREKGNADRRGPMIANGALIAMALLLLMQAHSATALASFLVAGGAMTLTILFSWARKPVFVSAMVLAILTVTSSAIFLNVGTGMVETLGRDATLTGRTAIWSAALSLVKDPIFGTGYESFWLGPRYYQMLNLVGLELNQSHSGYVEIFLNLGWIGVGLLTLVLIAAYARIVTALRCATPVASLRLAFFIAAILQNLTEASFKMMHPVWIVFLLAAMAIPEVPRPGQFPSFSFNRANDPVIQEPEETTSAVVTAGRHAYGIRRNNLMRTRQ